MADQPKCLCIVARDRLRGSDFIAALGASLRPDDQLEIIVDRRRGEPSDDWDRAEERRQRPQVDLALRANGFALVPAPSPKGERIARGERAPLSLLLPSGPRSRAFEDDDDDEERLEAIRSFKRERSRGLAPWLVAALAAVAAAAVVLSPAGETLRQSLGHRASPQAPGPASPPSAQAPDASPAPRGPAGAEKPVAQAPARAPAGEEASPLPSRDAASAAAPGDRRAPPVESSAPPRAAQGTAGRER
ncbi:MAG TPA: hypothetical protein VN977_03260, partial [Candidatus Binatia bacterium]|nr:hypothetical protein [Candidatus Binatia bacterium]